jgi:lipoyl-dependent peroxiredoxin
MLPEFDQARGRQAEAVTSTDAAIDAEVDLGTTGGAYGLAARLKVSLPGIDRGTAQALVDGAHQVCTYSRATRGNVDVTITLV